MSREIEKLQGMTLLELRAAWVKRLGKNAPELKGREILIRILAWKLQADALGGHSTSVQRKLAELGTLHMRNPKALLFPSPTLKPGIVLTRPWNGVVHQVQVLHEGFLYQDKTYASLSMVAKVITGTGWSGPRFFGIEQIIRRQLREQAKAP
jgi:hypothetical protein